MSDQLHGAALMRRVMADHRKVIVPLAVVFAVDVLVFALGVYPLQQRVANIEQREHDSVAALAQARREYDAAQGALTGKERASVELATFYKDVLPHDLAGARRLTYLRLAQLARDAGLRMKTSTYDPEIERGSTLERMKIAIKLEGSYENIRGFLYQLDTAPEFVVIDDVALSEGSGERNALELSVKLSTYYRVAGP